MERPPLPPDHPALRRPLPVVCGNEPTFNLDKCFHGKKCDATVCIYWHSEKEKRCPWFTSNDCEHIKDGHCRMGLHIDVKAVCETFTVDLECPVQANRLPTVRALCASSCSASLLCARAC